MSILVVGSVALDTIQTPFGSVKDALGGSATYFAYAASFFAPVRMVAAVGKDFPASALKLLEDRGISLDGLERSDGKTFRWSGAYENDMNAAKTLATELNVLSDFHPKVPLSYKSTSNVFLANVDPDQQIALLDQIDTPKLVGCDTMNLWIATKQPSLRKLLKRVDIFLLNDGEARQLTGLTNLVKAGNELLKLGPRVVVIKKGEHGAILLTKKFFFVAPAYPVEDVFDPTGAGDCFAGGFFASLSTSKDPFDEVSLRQAVIFGTVIASFNVESFSLDRLKSVTADQILSRYDQFRRYTHFEPADRSTTIPVITVTSK